MHHKLSCKAQPLEPVLRGGGGGGGSGGGFGGGGDGPGSVN